MTRTIQAPGIELREVDKSQYSKQDYSLVGTTSLVCGVASKGDNYNINWINTTQNFLDTYGAPETEEEKWFYNAANEVLTKGGILLASRLPYCNEANNGFKLAYADYKIIDNSTNKVSADFPQVAAVDTTLKKYIRIDSASGASGSGYMSLDQFDKLKVSEASLPARDTIRVVDLTRGQYSKAKITTTDSASGAVSEADAECLGIMPVITTAANALYYQGIISSETSCVAVQTSTDPTLTDNFIYEEQTGHFDSRGDFVADLSCYSPVADFKQVYKLGTYEKDRNAWQPDNYSIAVDSKSINDNTVSKLAAELFPTISFTDSGSLDKTWLKKIGVVIFQISIDKSTREHVTFMPVESYVGSLDKDSKDPDTKQSDFIDTIVNSQSSLVNVFTSFPNAKQKLELADILVTQQQIATSLGFYSSMCLKAIDPSFTVLNALNIVLDLAKDTNKYNIDLVVDAGVSNFAQREKWRKKISPNNPTSVDPKQWKITSVEDTKVWKAVQQKFNIFCQNIRRDCMFIADGLKPFCLDGDMKIVRPSNPKNTVSNSIIPKLKLMPGLNSSYAAGYCNWFQANEAYSGDLIWLPPSIKMAGIYIYTDAYFNKWDAPAGLARGRVTNVVDCAFSPSQQEAEKIYLQSWNYAVSYPIDGIVVEGQKTQQLRPTAFDRINVRRLFLHLEKEVARIAKFFLYEGNNEYQRNRFVDQIKPIFDDAVNHNGILEYYIKCDSENNTPHTIDNNELHCAIAVKPVKSIEFIVLTFVCTNQSAIVTESLAGIQV